MVGRGTTSSMRASYVFREETTRQEMEGTRLVRSTRQDSLGRIHYSGPMNV